jgi:hypothetical protein
MESIQSRSEAEIRTIAQSCDTDGDLRQTISWSVLSLDLRRKKALMSF